MTLNPAAVDVTSESTAVSWTADDASLYALAVGAGPDDLAFTTENTRGISHQALPTMAVTLGMDTRILKEAGDIDWTEVVHAEQSVLFHDTLPPSGEAQVTTRIADIWDKGSAGLLVLQTDGQANGDRLFTSRTSLFIRGAGGWGGDRGPRPAQVEAHGSPTLTVSTATRRDQALLYRLCGDHNPLHSDPAFAAAAGFQRPILHGLCTFGIAGRVILKVVADSDPSRLAELSARFAAPVFPGDTVHFDIWLVANGATFVARRDDGTVVLSHGVARIGPAKAITP